MHTTINEIIPSYTIKIINRGQTGSNITVNGFIHIQVRPVLHSGVYVCTIICTNVKDLSWTSKESTKAVIIITICF